MFSTHRRTLPRLAAFALVLAWSAGAPAAETKPVQRLVVEFYSDPEAKFAVEEVSVQYGSDDTSAQAKAEHFFQYAGRIMFSLDQDSPVFQVFVQQVLGGIDRGITKKTDVLVSEHYRMKLVAPREGARKTCTADFFEDLPAKTLCSRGGEGYYGPMSVFAFLQHIIDTSSDAELAEITRHLYRLFAALAEHKKQLAAEDAPATPERLVMRWVASMGRCVPGGPPGDETQKKARNLLAARLLVARYLLVDMLLFDRLKAKPKCRQAYLEQVNGLLTDNANEAEAMRVFGKPYKMWLAETAGELLGRVKGAPKAPGGSSLSTRLAAAAAAFDARFEGKDEVISAAAACLEADAQVIGSVAKVAAGMCE